MYEVIEICRICLNDGIGFSDMFKFTTPNLKGPSIGYVLNQVCPGLKYIVSNKSSVCKFCVAELESAYSFKLKCLQTEDKIQKYLAEHFEDTIKFQQQNNINNIICKIKQANDKNKDTKAPPKVPKVNIFEDSKCPNNETLILNDICEVESPRKRRKSTIEPEKSNNEITNSLSNISESNSFENIELDPTNLSTSLTFLPLLKHDIKSSNFKIEPTDCFSKNDIDSTNWLEGHTFDENCFEKSIALEPCGTNNFSENTIFVSADNKKSHEISGYLEDIDIKEEPLDKDPLADDNFHFSDGETTRTASETSCNDRERDISIHDLLNDYPHTRGKTDWEFDRPEYIAIDAINEIKISDLDTSASNIQLPLNKSPKKNSSSSNKYARTKITLVNDIFVSEGSIIYTKLSKHGDYIEDHDYLTSPYARHGMFKKVKLLKEGSPAYSWNCHCFICGEFYVITDIEKHHESHSSTCEDCNIDFKNAYTLNMHLKFKDHSKYCYLCRAKIPYSSRKHFEEHDNTAINQNLDKTGKPKKRRRPARIGRHYKRKVANNVKNEKTDIVGVNSDKDLCDSMIKEKISAESVPEKSIKSSCKGKDVDKKIPEKSEDKSGLNLKEISDKNKEKTEIIENKIVPTRRSLRPKMKRSYKFINSVY